MEQFPSRLAFLFNRYTAGICTPEERDEYLEMVKMDTHSLELQQLISEAILTTEADESLTPGERDAMLQEIWQREKGEVPVISMRARSSNKTMWWAAAAVILLLATGAWYWLIRTPKTGLATTEKNPVVAQDVAPGGNKAMLTLADGSKIILDNAANGQLTQQGKTTVIKSGDGQLVYTRVNEKPGNPFTIDHSPLTFNTLATPRGGQYQLVLPDGSKVWLNAASSIRYPTAFTGDERKVEITGEAYFEVEKVKNAAGQKIPFKVAILPSTGGVGGGLVEVLGTHFNINAYNDEPAVKTTLLEGSVKITEGAASAILKPGEQAMLSANSPLTINHSPNLDQVMAWKNGSFYFNAADIQTIMRQVARWYDVDVVYEGKIPEGHFKGKMARDVSLSQMLRMLEVTGVKYRIQGKKVIIQE